MAGHWFREGQSKTAECPRAWSMEVGLFTLAKM